MISMGSGTQFLYGSEFISRAYTRLILMMGNRNDCSCKIMIINNAILWCEHYMYPDLKAPFFAGFS